MNGAGPTGQDHAAISNTGDLPVLLFVIKLSYPGAWHHLKNGFSILTVQIKG